VRAFHSLKKTSTVALYIQQSEAAMNLMRRDSLGLPDDYYVNSFIFGLTDYVQAHLQCHKPNDLQQAMWLARRMEPAVPHRKTYNNPQFPVKRQVQFDAKPANAAPAIVIQAKIQGLCYKCKEPWFPGHKKVCKLHSRTTEISFTLLKVQTVKIKLRTLHKNCT
jgi:hypothetical protein